MRFIKKLRIKLLLLLLLLSMGMISLQAEEMRLTPTPWWSDYYGYMEIDGEPVAPGTAFRVEDPDGIICGEFEVTTAGFFGYIHVYGDDPNTPEDEGAESGDALSFFVDNSPTYSSEDIIWVSGNPGVILEVFLQILPPLHANFMAEPIVACVSEPVQFTDLSSGVPDSWEWDFDGDGIIDSYEPHPTWQYCVPGTYSVSLTVTDDDEIDTEIKENYIMVDIDLEYGLIAFYPFNGNAMDESTNSNHGSVNGAALTTDRFGNPASAYDFDGENDWINTYDTVINGACTITAWIKTDQESNDYADMTGTIVSTTYNHGGYGYGFLLKHTNESMSFAKYPHSSQGWSLWNEEVIEINNDQWHFVTGTWDGTTDETGVRLYVDGILVADTTSVSTIISHNFNLRIGYCNDGPYHFFHKGKIDDIRIYDHPLTELEILELYNEGGWTGEAELVVNPNPIDFGDVTINQTADIVVMLSNTGDTPLTVYSIDAGEPFVMGTYENLEITNSSSLLVNLSFSPDQTIFYSSEFIIDTNYGTYSIPITANGVAPTPDWSFNWTSYDFGQSPIPTGSIASLVISNTGNLDITVSAGSISDEHFTLSENSFLLPAGQSNSVSVGFYPTELTLYNCLINFSSEAGSQDIILNGSGYYPSAQPSITYLETEGFNGNHGVNPQVGAPGEFFEYRIIYSDPDNEPPLQGFPQVGIDKNSDGDFIDPGEILMPLVEVDPDDNDYAGGKEYSFITTLPVNSVLGYKFFAYDERGNPAGGEATIYRTGPNVTNDYLDLSIYANDISFSDNNPAVGQEINITAQVHNSSDFPAYDVPVTFYEEDELIFESNINYLPAQSVRSVSLQHIFIAPEYYPIKVVIDEPDDIDEANELNNFAIRPVLVGDASIPGALLASSYLSSSTAYPQGTLRFFGSAMYVNTRFRDTAAAGAQVVLSIYGSNYSATQIGYTDGNGDFYIYFNAPSQLGTYFLSAEITDFSLTTETSTHSFSVIPPPTNPILPDPEELPDLQIYSLNFTGTPTIYNPQTLSGTFSNIGNYPALNVLLHLYVNNVLTDTLHINYMNPGDLESFSFNKSFVSNGYHYAQVVIDPYNSIQELIEYNNSASASRYLYPLQPDLTPVNIVCSNNSPMTDQSIDFTFWVKNLNYISSSETMVEIYDINAGGRQEILLHTFALPSLGFRESSALYLPNISFSDSGVHQIRIEVDPDDLVLESNENNQILYHSIHVQEPAAELTISAISVSNYAPEIGDYINFIATVSNLGTAAADSVSVVFFRDSLQLGDMTIISALQANEMQIIASNPWQYDGLPHEISAQVDVDNTVFEPNEYNNSSHRTIGVDFIASKPAYPANSPDNPHSIPAGSNFLISSRITNAGCFAAQLIPVAYLLDDEPIAQDNITFINPGVFALSSIYHQFDLTGDYTITVIADQDSLGTSFFNEINEANNSVNIYLRVYQQNPDLEILSQYIAPEELNPDQNEPIAIYASIFNNGNVDSDSFMVRISVDDEVLDQNIMITNLPAHEDTTIIASEIYSSDQIGQHIITVEVDYTDLVTEYNENNNIATRAIIVGDAPDFKFDSSGIILSNQSPQTGDLINISAWIKNTGAADASAQVNWWSVVNEDSTLISVSNIFAAAHDSVNVSVNWYTNSPAGKIYARILNSSPPEFNTFNNWACTTYGGTIILLQPIEPVFVEEDQANFFVADLDSVFLNIDSTPLTYLVSSTDHIQGSLNSTNELFLALTPNWFGSGQIYITAQNIYGDDLSIEVDVTVYPVNDTPQIDLPVSFAFAANSILEVDFSPYIFDQEDDSLTIYVDDNVFVNALIDGHCVTFSAQEFWTGAEVLTFTVDDNQSRATSSDNVEIIVFAPPLEADFSADPLSGSIPLLVQFSDLSSSQTNYWEWDFQNDGFIDSYEQNPIYTFEENGIYDVKLHVADGISRTEAEEIKYDFINALPDWQVEPDEFVYNGTITACIYVDEVQVDYTDGIFACFVNDQCRGIASLDDNSVFDYTDEYGYVIYQPNIFSNLEVGEILHFYFWEPRLGKVLNVNEQFVFNAGMNLGSFDDPVLLYADYYTPSNIELVQGLNWFSLNIAQDNMDINYVLESLDDNAAYIKNQTGFAGYYPQTGWLGSIAEFNLLSMYKIFMTAPDTLRFQGLPVETQEMVYNLSSGWNWISYSPKEPENVNYALSNLGNYGTHIKNYTAFAIYYPSNGWFGPLNVLQPFEGYMMRVSEPVSFTYSQSPQGLSSRFSPSLATPADCNISKNFDPHKYEYNGILVITLQNDLPLNSLIFAQCNSEIRGVSVLMDYSGKLNRKFYALMVYSNKLYEEGFQLLYQDDSLENPVPLYYEFEFSADMFTGTFADPVILAVPQENEYEIPSLTCMDKVYPNPFNPNTTMNYQLAETCQVMIDIFNIKGQKVAELLNEKQKSGSYSISWQPENISSGIYLLRFKAGDYSKNSKLILLK